MAHERTLVILKPDAVNRGLVGTVMNRFERKGLKIVGLKMENLEEKKLKEHYAHHKDKHFFEELLEYMSSIPSVLVVFEGKDAVAVVRKMAGATSGRDAEPGTIRGDFSMSIQVNVIHASGSTKEAEKEIKRFFGEKDLMEYERTDFGAIYSSEEKK
ncbi:MAG: nucleoside-diphosphate kinase [Candidatus Diapherotrites archaeon]|nr:nucleoside-diphosphate kinase [Candidatus Diapherotrites archaeon]